MGDTRPLSQKVANFIASGVGNRKVTVFRGTVTAIGLGGRGRAVTFLADACWASPVAREVVVETGSSDADCGYHFEVGKEYLVFADSFQGKPWYTDICMLTTSRGGELIGYLGRKTEIPSEVPWWLSVIGSISCLSVVVYVLVGRRAKARDASDEEEVDG